MCEVTHWNPVFFASGDFIYSLCRCRWSSESRLPEEESKKQSTLLLVCVLRQAENCHLSISHWKAMAGFKETLSSRTQVWLVALGFEREGEWQGLVFQGRIVLFGFHLFCSFWLLLGRNGFWTLNCIFCFYQSTDPSCPFSLPSLHTSLPPHHHHPPSFLLQSSLYCFLLSFLSSSTLTINSLELNPEGRNGSDSPTTQ